MSSNPATWNSLPAEIKRKIFDMIFEIQPGPKTPDNLTVFCVKNPNPNTQLCLGSYHETNRVMSPKTLKEWENIPQGLLSKVRHLYVLFERGTKIEDITKLAENRLRQNNHLLSITIDISRMSAPIPPDDSWWDYHWEREIVNIIIPLLVASEGCLERVTVVTKNVGDWTRNAEAYITRALWSSPPCCNVVPGSPNLLQTVWALSTMHVSKLIKFLASAARRRESPLQTPEESTARLVEISELISELI